MIEIKEIHQQKAKKINFEGTTLVRKNPVDYGYFAVVSINIIK